MPKTVNELLNSDIVLLQDDGTTGGGSGSDSSSDSNVPIIYYPPSLNNVDVYKVPYYETLELDTNYNSLHVNQENQRPWINYNYYGDRNTQYSNWCNYDVKDAGTDASKYTGYAFATFTTEKEGFLDFNLQFTLISCGSSDASKIGSAGSFIALYCYNGKSNDEPYVEPSENDLLNIKFYTTKLNKADDNFEVLPSLDAKKFYQNYENYTLLTYLDLKQASNGKDMTLAWSGWVKNNTKFAIVGRAFKFEPHTSGPGITQRSDNPNDSLYYIMYVPKTISNGSSIISLQNITFGPPSTLTSVAVKPIQAINNNIKTYMTVNDDGQLDFQLKDASGTYINVILDKMNDGDNTFFSTYFDEFTVSSDGILCLNIAIKQLETPSTDERLQKYNLYTMNIPRLELQYKYGDNNFKTICTQQVKFGGDDNVEDDSDTLSWTGNVLSGATFRIAVYASYVVVAIKPENNYLLVSK